MPVEAEFCQQVEQHSGWAFMIRPSIWVIQRITARGFMDETKATYHLILFL